MKTLHRKDIPTDFSYYRTGSKVFFEYYKKYSSKVIPLGRNNEFITAFQILPGFWTISAEKHDIEITPDFLLKNGIYHGIVWWTPMHDTEKPKWWLRVPTWLTRWNIHSSRSAFSILDREDYWMKWSSKARAHRRHVLEDIQKGVIRIEKNISLEQFLEIYKDANIKDPNKGFVYRMTKKLFSEQKSWYRIFLAYVDNVPLAGALFLDERMTSEYWASFYARESHPYHLGIALMDAWYLDSYEKWIKYCDLDHMRDSWQSLGYAWYTKFKSSIADHDVYFHDMWVKIF